MKLETLARYDDLLSDVLVDSLYLWFQTHKMNPGRHSACISVVEVVKIVQDDVVIKRSIDSAVERLLSLEYFQTFLRKKSIEDMQGFVNHSKRYLSIYHPEAGFEIGQTHRYKTRKAEASVVATKRWEIGEEIRCCSGGIALLNAKELYHLEQKKKDFSVMWSSRKNSYCLFLGPARFVNHDCSSNCKFESFDRDGIYLKVVKAIEVGEEITTYYGGNYFGNKNCECQCATCERVGEGAFKPTIQSILEGNKRNRNRRRSLRKRSCNVSYNSDSTTKPTIEQRYDGKQAMRDKYGILFDLLQDKSLPLDGIEDGGILDFVKLSQSISIDNSAALSAISDLLIQVKSTNLRASPGEMSNIESSTTNINSPSIRSLPSQIIKVIQTCTFVCSVCRYIWVDDALFSDEPTVICMQRLQEIQTKVVCPRCERHEKIFGIKWPDRLPEPISLLRSQQLLLGHNGTGIKKFNCSEQSQGKISNSYKITRKSISRTVHSSKSKRRRMAKLPSRRGKGLDFKQTKPYQENNAITSIRHEHDPASFLDFIQDNQISEEHIGPTPPAILNAEVNSRIVKLAPVDQKMSDVNGGSELSEIPTSELNSVSDVSESHTPADIDLESSPLIYQRSDNGVLAFNLEGEGTPGNNLPIIKTNILGNSSTLTESPMVPGIPVLEFDKTTAVFVNPLDDEEPFWWPALLVPTSEIDESMHRPKSGQYIVRYFEDGTYSLCWPNEFVIFDSTANPFIQFKKLSPGFLHHVAVRRALAFLETDQVPREIKWTHWQRNHNKPLSQQRYEDVAIIKTYTYMIGDEVQVKSLEDPESSWKALIKDVDVLNNVDHKGLHYYVHYSKANIAQAEWVSPSRLV